MRITNARIIDLDNDEASAPTTITVQDGVIESIEGDGSTLSGVVSSAWSCAVPNSGVAACMFHSCSETSSAGPSRFDAGAFAFLSASSENMMLDSALRVVGSRVANSASCTRTPAPVRALSRLDLPALV